jgi:hypothetical protein
MITFKDYVVSTPLDEFLEHLMSDVYEDEMLNEDATIPIHKESPIARVKRAFDNIGEGKNPHTGEALPDHGSKAYKDMVKNAHARLKANHGVAPNSLLAGNHKLQDSTGEHIRTKNGKMIFTQGLSLAPAHIVCGVNTCPKASTKCKEACLAHTSGAMARSQQVKDAKIRKTEALFKSPEDTAIALHHHITKEKKLAEKAGDYGYSVRMNTTSDIPQKVYHGLRKAHPDVQFYDYTKEHKQVLDNLANKKEPGHKNLHLTFSSTGVNHEESNWHHCRKVLDAGGNVAMVSRSINKRPGKELKPHNILPTIVHDQQTGKHYPTLDGDGRSHDLDGHGDARFLDKPGHVVMLHLKGVHPNKAGNFAVAHDPKTRIAHV